MPLLRFEVPLAPFTTFGIGGPARLFADAGSAGELLAAARWARAHDVPYAILGRGSNVLVADDGFAGLVVRNAASRGVELLPRNRLRADSGVDVGRLIALTVAHGLSGLEHFAGVPATLGGALVQDLHFLSPDRLRTLFVCDLVEEATVLVDDAVERVDAACLAAATGGAAPAGAPPVVLDATLRLTPLEPAALRRRVRANLAWREERHPTGARTRSAGCAFRNPPGGSAARAIDAAGLKGRRVGGAVVSSRHANFVLNTGGASAADVRALVQLVRERVERHTGLRLEPEITGIATAL